MVVLQNTCPGSGLLFWPAKTGGIPKLELGHIESSLLPLELAKFTALGGVHDCHHSIERDAVALIADSAHRHQRSSDCSDLENRLLISILVREVQLALTQVRDGASISHEELLAASTPR